MSKECNSPNDPKAPPFDGKYRVTIEILGQINVYYVSSFELYHAKLEPYSILPDPRSSLTITMNGVECGGIVKPSSVSGCHTAGKTGVQSE